ncbi:MAG: DegQ family serine endoprotease [Deltaproteobacteria bacterium]|nr:DegQ family serine endoprotease [Deltaproteobacteria bacterium]
MIGTSFSSARAVLAAIPFALYASATALCLSPVLRVEAGESRERSNEPPVAAPIPYTLPDFINLAERLSAAVVNISTFPSSSSTALGEPPLGGRGGDPFHEFWEPFERFFGPFPPHSFQQKSMGSGFILDKRGYILTNNHVVENAGEILVKLTDEKEYKANLVGADPKTDLALIKIDGPAELTTIVLGDSDTLRVGEWVMAIGNPFGLDHTVTAGIVSAKGRNIGHGPYDQFIQTDASINPGNSGGPLINLRGEVVGINTAIYSRTGGNVGIGFAIPINVARDLVPQLQAKGKVTRGWLGVMIQKVTPEIAASLGLPEARGARVAEVVQGGPAQAAGLKVGDVIVAFNGRTLNDSAELPLLVARTPVGETAVVEVVRADRERKTVSVRIVELREEGVTLAAQEPARWGLAVRELSPALRDDLGVGKDLTGVLVSQVEQGSVAEEAGVQQGDIVLEVNRQKVRDLPSYRAALQKTEQSKHVLLLIRRGESTFFLTLKAAG